VTGEAWAEEAQALLAAAESRLAELRQAWAAALARAHQAEQEWQAASQAAARQDAGVDQALRAGQDGLARARQRELNQGRGRLEALAQRRQLEMDLSEELAAAIHTLALHIAAARLSLDTAAAHEQAAAGREQLQALSQTLARLAAVAGRGKDR
jgi:phage shock protein A